MRESVEEMPSLPKAQPPQIQHRGERTHLIVCYLFLFFVFIQNCFSYVLPWTRQKTFARRRPKPSRSPKMSSPHLLHPFVGGFRIHPKGNPFPLSPKP